MILLRLALWETVTYKNTIMLPKSHFHDTPQSQISLRTRKLRQLEEEEEEEEEEKTRKEKNLLCRIHLRASQYAVRHNEICSRQTCCLLPKFPKLSPFRKYLPIACYFIW